MFPKSPENFKIYDLGLKAHTMGDYSGAVKCFKRVIETEPEITSCWYMVLECLSYLGNWKEMIIIGDEVLKIDPNYGPIYYWLGEAYIQLGNRKKALDCYEKGLNVLEKELARYPNNDTILTCIGEIYISLGKYEEAIKYSKKASIINPKNEHHLHSIGLAYKELKKYDKAIEFYEKSLNVNPKHSYAWFDLGLIYQDLNKINKAIKCYEKAVECSPQWVKLREKLVELKPDSNILLKKAPDIRILFAIPRQEKLSQLKKLLSEGRVLMQKINRVSNENKKKDLYQQLKVLSHSVEEKRKEIYNTEKTLKSTIIIPLSDLSVEEIRLLWELMKLTAKNPTEFMELMNQEMDYHKDMSEEFEKLKKMHEEKKEK